MPPNPLLQLFELLLQQPIMLLSPPHNNSKIRIMKIELNPLSHLLSLQQDVVDKSLIVIPPIFDSTSYAASGYIYISRCD